MGCCASHTKLQIDIPFERMDEYNKVKKDIEEFLDNKDPNVRSDSNKILDLLIKTSNVISKYENDLRILKKNKNDSKDIGDDLIEGINQDIKVLRSHHITLNNLLKESEYPQTNKKEEIFNEEINPPQSDNNIENDNNNYLSSERNNEKNNSSSIYFKKALRRNKKGVLNQKYNNINNNKNELIRTSENNNNNELLYDEDDDNNINNDINNNIHNEINNEINYEINNDINLITLIFEFENGKKVQIQSNKEDKLMDVIIKLSEEELFINDLNLLEFYYGDNLLNEKIENGDKIEDFNFDENEYHLIQVKFKEKNNENEFINENENENNKD